jgi:hypothetical protein
MRMLLSALALLFGAYATSSISFADTPSSPRATPPLAPGQHTYAFRCPHGLLRVMFDGDRNVAVIHRFGRPTVTMTAQARSDQGFHFSNATYDLQGTFEEVRFRIGQGEAMRCRRGSLNG